MQKINILFFNQHISKSKVRKILCDKYNLFAINFIEEFRKQLMEKEENELSIRIKSFMDNGELVPNYLLEELLKTLFKESQNQDILLTEFPKTTEQFLMLKKILNDLNLEIQTIWYIKQKNAEEYMDMHFKNPNEKLWLDKYGDEVIEKWKQEFEKKQIFITEMQNMTDSKIWKVVEMDCETELDEELLIKKINDCA